jgi:hypothetical protein
MKRTNARKKKAKNPDEPTPSEKKHAEEYERHVTEAMPTVTRNRQPVCVRFSRTAMEVIGQTKLTEHAIGCASHEPDAPPPIMFEADGETDVDSLIRFVDSANLTNWGYPDGCTAIHLPDGAMDDVENPIAVHRGSVPSDGFTDLVFFCPCPVDAMGTAASSSTGDVAEVVVAYDRIAACAVPPPFGRHPLRDRAYRERYSELHVLAKFASPPGPDLVCAGASRERIHPLENRPFPAGWEDAIAADSSRGRSREAGKACIAPPGRGSRVCDVRVAEFVAAAKRCGARGIMAFVVSDPMLLLSQKRTAKRIMTELRGWRASTRPPGPAAVPVPRGPVDGSKFVSDVAEGRPVSDEDGTAWNNKATAADVALLLKTAGDSPAAVAWATWRLVSGSAVAMYYSGISDRISAGDVFDAMGPSAATEFQFVMAGKAELSLMGAEPKKT